MNIKTAYYYFFYKLYKFGEWSPSVFPSDFTAAFAIAWFEAMIFASLLFYSTLIWGRPHIKFVSVPFLTPLVIIWIINYFAFVNDSKWKYYVHKFDKLPKEYNQKGTWIVIGIVAFIIGNLALSASLLK